MPLIKKKHPREDRHSIIVVITGATGVGKDEVVRQLELKQSLPLRRFVTHADRLPRPNEIHGRDYFFVTPLELDQMHKNDELVEPPTFTGTTRKATSKRALLEITNTSNSAYIWRIDPSRAGQIAKGSFFSNLFPEKLSRLLQRQTLIVCLKAHESELIARRQTPERKADQGDEYAIRDQQEAESLDQLEKLPEVIKIDNHNGQLSLAVGKLEEIILDKLASSPQI